MHRLFQFSPPRGGRRTVLLCCACPLYFNSRPRVGGRLCPDCGMDEALRISILAPARGATPRRRHSFRPSSHFNSRSRAGGDERPMDWKQTILFQFSPPRGGRRTTATRNADTAAFQFSPPRGGDLLNPLKDAPLPISIPAPVWEATPMSWAMELSRYFNSRPHAGGDIFAAELFPVLPISIPAPARGATRLPLRRLPPKNFNSRPRAGGDR